DVDMVFDARCLPNPHWQPGLRGHTGLEARVRAYLESHPIVDAFCDDVLGFVRRWLPALAEDQRSLVTVAIGCTGGQHRSVYVVDRMARQQREDGLHVRVSHRELAQGRVSSWSRTIPAARRCGARRRTSSTTRWR